MGRNDARSAVYGTLQSFGVPYESVTRKTKIGSVISIDARVDFVKQLHEWSCRTVTIS